MAVSTTVALVVSAVVAAAASAAGAAVSSNAQRKAADYNAKVAENNALMASQQGAYEAERIRDRNRRILASQQVGFAKAGVDITTGTAEAVFTDSSVQGEMDALAALYTGNVGAADSAAQSRLYRMQSTQARNSGYIGVGTSLLAGASSGLSNYAIMKR